MRKNILILSLVGAFVMIAALACAGEEGATGAAGAVGATGPQGAAGADGAAGPQGPAGADGTDGADGATGPAGAKGATGDAGPAGRPGAAGATGPAGSDGSDGIDWPGLIPVAYTAADGIAGGTAYSKWYSTEAGGTGQPNTTVAADFYRCKSCHAWDGLGNSGSYSDRTGQSSGKATRPDVAAVNLRSSVLRETPSELYDLIARPTGRVIDAADNTHPAFADVLTEAQIWNLVKFMREEWVEPTDLYTLKVEGPIMHWDYSTTPPTLATPTRTYSDIGIGGDATKGDTRFASTCASCHTADGTGLGISVGKLVRIKPHEIWLKAKFGEPGAMEPGMVTDLQDLKDLFKALSDPVKYPD